MKVCVAGPRDAPESVKKDLYSFLGTLNITEIVSGKCKTGVDLYGEQYANKNGIKVIYFEPNWELYGDRAGPLRNKQMARYSDILVLVWDRKKPSKGSLDMFRCMKSEDKPIYEIKYSLKR